MNACISPTVSYRQGRTGTDAGYQAHGRAGEKPCVECHAAHISKGAKRWAGLSEWERDVRREQNRAERARYQAQPHGKAKAASRKYRLENRSIIRKAKDKPCVDCGQRFHYAAMEFDHLGDKSFNIGSIGPTASRSRLLAEIEKCEIVCANCHAMRTFRRRFPEEEA